MITAMEMPDWEVRQHRATLIRFEDKTWRVASKTMNAGKIHYDLAPWEPADHERTGRHINYNAEYVALRDQAAPRVRAQNRATGFLRYLAPLIGFLPARTKAQLEMTHGVDPVSATFQSVFLEFLITIGSFAMAAIGVMALAGTVVSKLAGGLGILAVLFVVIGVVVGIDGSVRYGRILNEERPPPGFYEWIVRRRA